MNRTRNTNNSLRGLGLDYNSKCGCMFCKINKATYQKLFRFIYGRELNLNEHKLWYENY